METENKGGLSRHFTYLFWLFVSPRNWANETASFPGELAPDFTLLQVYRDRVANQPAVEFHRNLLIARTLVTLSATILILLMLETTVNSLVFGLSVCFGVTVFGGLMGDLLISVAGGTIGATIAGIIAGVGYGIVGHEGFTGIFADSEPQLFVLIVAVLVGIGSTSSISIDIWKNESADTRVITHLGIILTGIGTALLIISLTIYISYLLAGKDVSNFRFGLLLPLSISFGTAFIIALYSTKRVFMFITSMSIVSVLTIPMALIGYYLDLHRHADSMFWNLIYGLTIGIGDGVVICALYGVVFSMANYLSGRLAAVFAALFGLVGAIITYCVIIAGYPLTKAISTILICGVIGLFFNNIRALILHPLYSVYNLALFRIAELKNDTRLYELNVAFLDEYAIAPQVCLYEHTMYMLEKNRFYESASAELLHKTRHHKTVTKACIEHETRLFERCQSVQQIAKLDTNTQRYFTSNRPELQFFRTLSKDCSIALDLTNPYPKEVYFKEFGERLLKNISGNHTNPGLDSRLTKLALAWNKYFLAYSKEIESERILANEVVNPYIVAVPLTLNQNLFVGRREIAKKIERLVLSEVHSPLLLYGPRRIGKTSLLNNLSNILPSSILPIFVDLQGPTANASDSTSFLYRLSHSATRSINETSDLMLPAINRQDYELEPFGQFDEWLDRLEQQLVNHNKTGLLTLDEFEALHNNFLTGSKLAADEVLGMLRHMIQHRRKIKLLLASSFNAKTYTIWSNYLVNLRPVVVSYLNQDDSNHLITRPVDHFPLRYSIEALNLIYQLTRGHPALLQLICSTIVDQVNSVSVKPVEVSAEFVKNVVDINMLKQNMFFFEDIEHSQTDEAGRRILSLVALHDGPVPRTEIQLTDCDDATLNSSLKNLVDRDVLESSSEGYSFQVELIRRWFVDKNNSDNLQG